MALDLPDYEVQMQTGNPGFNLAPVEGPSAAPTTGLNLDQSGSTGGFALDPDEVARITSRATVANSPGTPSLATTMKALRQNFLADKSGLQKFGYALDAFGSGINGQDSRMDREIRQGMEAQKLEMQKKQEELAAFKATYGMFDESFKILKKVPVDKRANAIQQLGQKMDSVSPGAGQAFTAYANFNDADLESSAMNLFGDPAVSQALMKLSGGDETNFYKLITNPETVKMLTSQVDQKRLPGIVQKMSAIRSIPQDQIPKDLLPRIKKDSEGNIMLDTALLRTVNDRLPKEMRFTDGDFQTIQRNPDQFTSAGFVSPKLAEDIAKKDLEKNQWSDPYMLDGVQVQKNKDTGQIKEVVSRPPSVRVQIDQKDSQVFEQEHKLRQDFDKASTKFQDMKSYFVPVARKIESGKPLGPAESLQLAYAYAHALDPASDRITEGDFQRMEKLGSIPQRVGVAIKGVLGGYNLPEDIAKEMYTVAARNFKELNTRQRANEDRYTKMATEYPGLSPERVVKKYSLDEKGSPKPPVASEGKRSVEQINRDAAANGWSDLTTENVIRDMHGEDAVRKWRTKISEDRLKKIRSSRGGS